MKTKDFFFIAVVAALMSSTQVMAQNTTGNKNVDPAELVNRRCNRMCTAMQLDDATAAKFTPLYKEYLNELRACRPATCPTECRDGNCTDVQRKACVENRLDCRENMAKVQKKYYAKFEKILNAQQLQTVFCNGHHAGNKHFKNGRRHNRQYCGRQYNCNVNGNHDRGNGSQNCLNNCYR